MVASAFPREHGGWVEVYMENYLRNREIWNLILTTHNNFFTQISLIMINIMTPIDFQWDPDRE